MVPCKYLLDHRADSPPIRRIDRRKIPAATDPGGVITPADPSAVKPSPLEEIVCISVPHAL